MTRRACLALGMTGLLLSLAASAQAEDYPPGAVLVCGWDEVFVIDLDQQDAQTPDGKFKKLWSWKADEQSGIPADKRRQFASTDDCKPVRNKTQVLISSSSGGCALVDIKTRKALWYASVTNAHSIELLPGNLIAVAGSTSNNGTGNRVVLFDANVPDKPLWFGPLHSGHGVVWDEQRNRLWALGFKHLEEYELVTGEGSPTLKKLREIELPGEGGHDLQPVPKSNDLVITTHDHVELFDRESRTFRKHPVWGEVRHAKCVSFHPVTGRPLLVHSNGKDWWNDTFKLLEPERTIRLEGEKLYKIRWLAE